MKQIAICHTCQHKHVIDFDPSIGAAGAYSDWITKHANHVIVFESPRRSRKQKLSSKGWNHYLDNADVKVAYAATAAVTITLASLAASSTLLAGRESTAVDNGAANKYLDELLAGFYRAGAANNQAGTIRTAIVGNTTDTPTWPDVFDGTDSVETVTDQPTYDSICRIISDIAADNTASQTWYWGPVGVASLFGGWLPDQYVVFLSHAIQTAANVWSATESDHGIKRTPVYATVV